MTVVSDSPPLVGFASIGRVELLEALYGTVVVRQQTLVSRARGTSARIVPYAHRLQEGR